MACDAERAAFMADDAKTTEAVTKRQAAGVTLNEAELAEATAALNLATAQQATTTARVDLAVAEEEVTTAGATANASYQAYLSCVMGDPSTPEPEQIAAATALHTSRLQRGGGLRAKVSGRRRK